MRRGLQGSPRRGANSTSSDRQHSDARRRRVGRRRVRTFTNCRSTWAVWSHGADLGLLGLRLALAQVDLVARREHAETVRGVLAVGTHLESDLDLRRRRRRRVRHPARLVEDAALELERDARLGLAARVELDERAEDRRPVAVVEGVVEDVEEAVVVADDVDDVVLEDVVRVALDEVPARDRHVEHGARVRVEAVLERREPARRARRVARRRRRRRRL
eukprot:CAMPEP_0185697894 /NCGR_PEP_ID=MMETSP1164-20130828/6020_1 /TAXON_ID=1104430 /ORGANISM="Chrysoreinhardia sp, Strain CCMP2950" /LENGTH=217 /DNA_ID=CAMNT_0028364793 /DNA_START=161 /DNA_END=810 /DNA_ORIENTATION=-